ncbi:hypothetical protein BD770DRAFT_438401 [Pilaira anomala]|nr:hypothetical protein BD770DRAFT_438401 [Pilaira anomala]
MSSSIEKEIDLMIERLAVNPNDYRVVHFLGQLNHHLLSYKPEGWSGFVYGSAAHGLATKNDTIDICVTNIHASLTTAEQPIIVNDTVTFEGKDISNNTDAVNARNLSFSLLSAFKKDIYCIIKSFQASIPFFTVKYYQFPIKLDISVNNAIDIERTNLVTEYLSLDKRIKPFLFALKQFVKMRKIDNETNGFPNSYVYVIIGLYFLMFVQNPPIIPCLHAMSDETPCNYPLCRSKSNEKVQGYDVAYHDCAIIDRISEYTIFERSSGKNLYGTPWISKNKKSTDALLLEAFKWFSYSSSILEPKSINSKKPPVIQPEWKHNVMAFADVFDPTLNIAASCTVAGAKIINQEFFNAYIKLQESDSFDKILYAPDTILKPIAVKQRKYTRN